LLKGCICAASCKMLILFHNIAALYFNHIVKNTLTPTLPWLAKQP